MTQWNALLVEDTADSAELVEMILAHHNIGYQTATSAEDALEVLKKFIPEIILIDLALPGMSGWELLQALRQDPRVAHLPMVAITAYHSTNVADEAIKSGFDAYFPKPIDATSFVRELQRFVPS